MLHLAQIGYPTAQPELSFAQSPLSLAVRPRLLSTGLNFDTSPKDAVCRALPAPDKR
jgi:hypothetical protein